ncbi:MAG: EAL domain-containing protein [Gammaproteobacteria bacterium]|jgi:diguanylate cyclase (GGDEF)-like protein/PAS domain S-box-containing protein|nr:EAL domain-containing protein [Gammaproteobacteria bacterium]
MLNRSDHSASDASTQLGDALQRAPMGLMVFDIHGRLLTANDRVAERLGYSTERLYRLRLSDIEADLSPDALSSIWRRVVDNVGGRPEIFVTRHRDAGGGVFQVEIRLAAIDLEGDTRVVMLATALTDNLDAQRRLQAHERIFRQVFRASEDAILLLEGNEFIDCNEAAVRMLRCSSKEDILPVPPWGLSPEFQPDGRRSTEKAREMIEIAYERHFHRFEWMHTRADGEDFPVEVTLTLLELGGRQILHVVWNDITERRRNERKIEELARYDLLTGLPNRRLLQERAEMALKAGERERRPVGVMYMDLDRFKDINDTQGHETGDRVLSEVANRLRSCLRHSDTVARLGGDEFAFLLPDTEPLEMQGIAERVIEMLDDPFTINGVSTRLGASIGLVRHPEDGRTLAELLKHADIAMYRAKEHQSGWCAFEPEQASNVLERVNLERDLRHAISAREISLHYQPILNASSGEICCVEALARWTDAEGRKVAPDIFIPAAESTGLIHPLGGLLLELACEQASRWREMNIAVPITLNVSARELQSPDLVERIIDSLDRHGLDGSALEIEITESGAMSNAAENLANLSRLRKHGIKLFIDDFGTGYSSLSQLKQLPVDTLKIDQSFVRDMVADPADADIVETIVVLAGAMGLATVAEGIETAEQFAAVRQLGCGGVQGYLFARPADAETTTERLRAGRIELPEA